MTYCPPLLRLGREVLAVEVEVRRVACVGALECVALCRVRRLLVLCQLPFLSVPFRVRTF